MEGAYLTVKNDASTNDAVGYLPVRLLESFLDQPDISQYIESVSLVTTDISKWLV